MSTFCVLGPKVQTGILRLQEFLINRFICEQFYQIILYLKFLFGHYIAIIAFLEKNVHDIEKLLLLKFWRNSYTLRYQDLTTIQKFIIYF